MISVPILKFRAWSISEKKFIATGFHIIGETTLFDMLNDRPLAALDDLIITQFIWDTDSDKKDIYVGDVIKWQFPEITENMSPERREQCRNICVVRMTEEEMDFHPGFMTSDSYNQGGNRKVIGNIFENPELENIKNI